jgi:hypothetical protein
MERGNKEREDRMTKQKAIALSILEALTESKTGGMPAGHMFVALMGFCGHMEFNSILAAMERVGWVTIQNHYVTATDKARALLEEVGA